MQPNTALSERARKKLTPKGERARQALLEAASELFSQRGYDATSIRDIEDAVDASRGSVTYHLGNKEDIWKAVIDFLFIPILRGMRSNLTLLQSLEPRARERNLIAQFIRTSARNPQMLRLMIQEGFQETWRNAFIVEHFLNPFRETLRALEEGSTLIRLINDDPHVRYTVLGACNMAFALPIEVRGLYDRNVYEDAFIDRHIDTVVSILESFLDRSNQEPSNG